MNCTRIVFKKNILWFALLFCQQHLFAMDVDQTANPDQGVAVVEPQAPVVLPPLQEIPTADSDTSLAVPSQPTAETTVPVMQDNPGPEFDVQEAPLTGPYYVTQDILNDNKDDDEGLSDAEIAALVAGGVAGLALLGAAGAYGAKTMYDRSKTASTSSSSDIIKKAKTPEDFARIQSALDTSTKNLQSEKESILAGKDLGRTAAETQQRLAAIDVQLKKNEQTRQQVQTAATTIKPIATNTPGNATPELDEKLRRVNNALSIYGVSSNQNLMDKDGKITLPKDMPDADKIRPLLEQRYQITQERNAILAGDKPAEKAQTLDPEKTTQAPEADKEEVKPAPVTKKTGYSRASKEPIAKPALTISEPVKKVGGARTDTLGTYLAGAKKPEDFKEIQSRLEDGEKDLAKSADDLQSKRAALVEEQKTKGDTPELRSRLAEIDQAIKDNSDRQAEVRGQLEDVKQVVTANEKAASAVSKQQSIKDTLAMQKKIASYKPMQQTQDAAGIKSTSAADTKQSLKDAAAKSKQRALAAQKAQAALKAKYVQKPTTKPVQTRW